MRLVVWFLFSTGSCDRPRGVSLTRASFYVEKQGTFTCLDGTRKIPYSQVNDDFCDCDDGSDEPGTSACPNGHYHCTNAGFKPINILSSRVNDMICDCCDGSDEWAGHVTCPNTCKEAYAQEYAQKIKENEVQAAGFKKREEKVAEASTERGKNAAELADFDEKLREVQAEKEKAEAARDSAELAEKAAKATIEAEKELRIREKASKYDDLTLSEIAFNHLDSNNNGELLQFEITSQKYLDPTPDSSFLPSEAKTLMKDKEKLTLDEFRTDLWPEIKDKIIGKLNGAMDRYERKIQEEKEKELEAQNEGGDSNIGSPEDEGDVFLDGDLTEEEIPEENENLEEEDEDHIDNMDDEFDLDDYDDDDYLPDYHDDDYEEQNYKTESEPVDSSLDPETQKIFDTANEARRLFNEANDRFNEIENRVKDIKELADKDFGEDDVFLTMYKKCYELRTNEYIYTLCPYDKCSQRPINGGSETKLGNWRQFSDNYTKMEFTGGVRCWNGPDRSATVVLNCGAEHKILSVTEPNRCEYEYVFETPAVCKKPEELTPHDEL